MSERFRCRRNRSCTDNDAFEVSYGGRANLFIPYLIPFKF